MGTLGREVKQQALSNASSSVTALRQWSGELGEILSVGERQQIGLARAFLHDAPLLLLDEPTSNLDSLNEGVILSALEEAVQSFWYPTANPLWPLRTGLISWKAAD